MKRLFLVVLAVNLAYNFQACKIISKELPITDLIDSTLNFAVKQSMLMAESLKNDSLKLPKTLDKNGKLESIGPWWWTSGFFPGQLWYLYEHSGNDEMKKWAHNYTMRVKAQQYTTDNHDVGFIIFCSFGNAFRITGEEQYYNVINTTAKSLSTRFSEKTGTIRSWDRANWNKQWQYPVIIDNMMNLELLMWTAREFNNNNFREIALKHANTTAKHHFRRDFSSFHVVSYDTITGDPELKHTSQGYNHESAWARGQAWGLYGFVMMYRESRDTAYLNQARNIARFIIEHPNLPGDKIPFWDFNAPDIPNAKRDASAAAIICSALIELSQFVNQEESKMFLDVAEKQIRTLSSPEYLASIGENGNFLLKHSVGHMPNGTEVDVPLSYADYYFVEALMRYKVLLY